MSAIPAAAWALTSGLMLWSGLAWSGLNFLFFAALAWWGYIAWRSRSADLAQTAAPETTTEQILKRAALAAFVAFLFAAKMNEIRLGGPGHTNAMAGLLPWSDAHLYWEGARRMLAFGELDEWNSRRPLNALALSLFHRLSSGDLQATLVYMMAAMSFAAMLVGDFALRAFGAVSAVMTALLLRGFAGDFGVGLILSEPIGFAFGCAAAPCLVHGFANRRFWPYIAGACLLTIGLLARSGAFFILPAVIAWAGWIFREKTERFAWRSAAVCLLAIAVPVSLNSFLTWYLNGSPAQGNANFSYTLYGILAGGKGWTYVFEAHPELHQMPEALRGAAIYRWSGELFRERPWMLLSTVDKVWHRFVLGDDFLSFSSEMPARLLEIFAVAAAFSVARAKLRDRLGLFLLSLVFAVALSAPALVDGYQRVFAATLPLTCLFVAYAMFKTQLLIAKNVAVKTFEPRTFGSNMAAGFGALAALSLLLSAGFAKKAAAEPRLASPLTCAEPGAEATAIEWPRGSRIRVVADGSTPELGTIQLADLARVENEQTQMWKTVPAGESILQAFDLRTRESVFLLAPTKEVDSWPHDVAEVCVNSIDGGAKLIYRYLGPAVRSPH